MKDLFWFSSEDSSSEDIYYSSSSEEEYGDLGMGELPEYEEINGAWVLKESENIAGHNEFFKIYSAPTFDDIDKIIYQLNIERENEGKGTLPIFKCDGVNSLLNVLSKINSDEVGNIKIGLVYRASKHGTPICIEKSNGKTSLYNTDSLALDVADKIEIKRSLIDASAVATVYSLGWCEGKTDKVFSRQHDEFSCFTFSYRDCEKMLETDFGEFARGNSVKRAKLDIYDLNSLPADFMVLIQSVNGQKSNLKGIDYAYKGLRQLVDENPELSSQVCETVGGIKSSLFDLLNELTTSGSRNESVQELNNKYLQAKGISLATTDLSSDNLSIEDLSVISKQQFKWRNLVSKKDEVGFSIKKSRSCTEF